MAQSVGQIGLDLVVNKNQFEKQMSGITNLAKKAGVALASAFAVKKLVDFGKSCIELGSDLAEVQNVVDVTFPSMTAQVDSFAKNAAASFGLSETMAKRFTGTFGAMAKAFGFSEKQAYDMSTTLTGLAGDVASFYNISQDEAYTKLKSVFTGETETLKDLGVVMTQNALDAYAMANGWGKTTQAMSEAEKVALRYQFVQDQLSAATGDFVRTSDSWANQVRVLKLQFDSLKATLGQGLINILTPVLKVLNQLLAKLMTVASAFKSFTEMLTGKKAESGAGFEDTASDLSAAAGAADSLTESTEGIGKAAEKASRSLMGFDKINKLQDKNASGAGGGVGVGSMDFGSLAEGDNIIDQTNQKMDGLVSKCHELASLCKKGFVIGFGNSQQKIESIKQSIKGIGQSFKDIFTDREVVSAAENLFNTMVFNAGRAAGSMASMGVTIADNLIGGIDGYLKGSKDYIKSRLISIFNVRSEISDLAGDLIVALADIDGHPQYAGIFGHPIADAYQTLLADRVEVLRGPASVLYGSNAMGGVVNIVTRKMHEDGIRTHLHTGYGSYNTLETELTNRIRKGRFSSVISGSYNRTDGHRADMGFEQYGGYGRIGYEVTDHWNLRADVNVTHFNASYPGPVSAPLLDGDRKSVV